MNEISDNKALALQEVSTSIKRLNGLKHFDCPKWTERTETVLSSLSVKDLKSFALLIYKLLRDGKQE